MYANPRELLMVQMNQNRQVPAISTSISRIRSLGQLCSDTISLLRTSWDISSRSEWQCFCVSKLECFMVKVKSKVLLGPA
jgi:hypothetical protein